MQAECFKRNLSGTNGGQDFDSAMLDEMYNAIRYMVKILELRILIDLLLDLKYGFIKS